MENGTQTYVVDAIQKENPNISTLFLTNDCGKILSLRAGQIIDVYFPETGTTIGKPYSVSSAPREHTLAITVHAIGEFSNRLCSMQRGDLVHGSLPYGSFRPRKETSDIVLLASGMGITSFRGLIQDALSFNPLRHIALFHSVRFLEDLIFKAELDYLSETHPNFSATYFVTRERPSQSTDCIEKRIQMTDVLSRNREVQNTEFLICGSFSFIDSMQKELLENGIAQDAITTSCISSLSGVLIA